MCHSENQGGGHNSARIIIPAEEIIEIVAGYLGRSTMHFDYWSDIREWSSITSQDVYKILEKIEKKYHIMWDEDLKDKMANQKHLGIFDIHNALQLAYHSYR